ncbi:MAG: hypothetical protein GF350_01695, partial [Chitinivibrionales bacterium]|nr:hypothetical protein [Chitinivibrionales bacterium]
MGSNKLLFVSAGDSTLSGLAGAFAKPLATAGVEILCAGNRGPISPDAAAIL